MRQLAGAAAKDACLLEPDGTERPVLIADLRPGDRFVTRPGETIAADGVAEFGESAVDASMMTGEWLPVDVRPGTAVRPGTIVTTGRIVVRAERSRDRHPAGAPDRAGSGRPGGQVRGAAPGRPDLPGVRARRSGRGLPDARGLAAGGQPGRTGGQRRAGRADHRVPVRARPGYPGGAGGRQRPRRTARHLHQGSPGAGNLAVGGHRAAGQDRHGHHRDHGRDRRAGRPGYEHGRAAAQPWRGGGRIRAPNRGGGDRARPRCAGRAGAGKRVRERAGPRNPRRGQWHGDRGREPRTACGQRARDTAGSGAAVLGLGAPRRHCGPGGLGRPGPRCGRHRRHPEALRRDGSTPAPAAWSADPAADRRLGRRRGRDRRPDRRG